MKQYVIDELRLPDYRAIKKYMDEHFESGKLDGIYIIPLQEELLTDLQREHTECQPHYLSVELDEQRVSCELLVRTPNRVRCNCIAYADDRQRNWVIQMMDAVLDRLGIYV